eukprot:CAMPEP_0194508306 /NCGR_PEP_ID=MMETSP0253-20130528/38409_1 /TAXON_ID=2966 /ORGANISM="Noctiluca scintillans" /LENGTH=87 /DNA_ID=CAMNT_0039351323 /DNA_START=747 /DNA_END=1006 /DNA_ORIENTATION=+
MFVVKLPVIVPVSLVNIAEEEDRQRQAQHPKVPHQSERSFQEAQQHLPPVHAQVATPDVRRQVFCLVHTNLVDGLSPMFHRGFVVHP